MIPSPACSVFFSKALKMQILVFLLDALIFLGFSPSFHLFVFLFSFLRKFLVFIFLYLLSCLFPKYFFSFSNSTLFLFLEDFRSL